MVRTTERLATESKRAEKGVADTREAWGGLEGPLPRGLLSRLASSGREALVPPPVDLSREFLSVLGRWQLASPGASDLRQCLLWSNFRSHTHTVVSTILLVTHRSGLFSVGGLCTRAGIQGGENHWRPSAEAPLNSPLGFSETLLIL